VVLLSLCLDIVDTVVVLYFLLPLSNVLFFFFLVVLPVMVNEDEYIRNL